MITFELLIVAEATVRRLDLEQATALRGRTKRQLEEALAWPKGMVDLLLDDESTAERFPSVVAFTPASLQRAVPQGRQRASFRATT